MIKRSIRRLGGQDRIILIGRNEIPDALLGTFWNREMGLVTQNSMLFDQDEVECLIKQYGSRTSPEQLLRYTGGWAGIVDVILRLESKYGAWTRRAAGMKEPLYKRNDFWIRCSGRKGKSYTLRSTSRG